MRRFVINLEGLGSFGMIGPTVEIEGESAEDALTRAGYNLNEIRWTLITVRDVEDND